MVAARAGCWCGPAVSSPADLVSALCVSSESNFVRVTAHWLTDARDLAVAPPLTSNRVVNALVSAAAAHAQFQRDGSVPEWTGEPERVLDRFWYPGDPNLFAYALVHSPPSFALHGILIEEESLVSV